MDLVPNTYVDRDHFSFVERNVSFSDLVLEYCMRLHSVWYYPLTRFDDSDPNIFWIASTKVPSGQTTPAAHSESSPWPWPGVHRNPPARLNPTLRRSATYPTPSSTR